LALAGLAFSAQQCHSNIIIVELTVFKVNTLMQPIQCLFEKKIKHLRWQGSPHSQIKARTFTAAAPAFAALAPPAPAPPAPQARNYRWKRSEDFVVGTSLLRSIVPSTFNI
jgi:hypothetical protein